jgi:cytochrome c oxidase cbb3-type subunit IV
MDWFTFLGSATTVVAMATFVGIVAWAYSKRRHQAFEQAANAPFALPDDVYDEDALAKGKSAERRS